MQVGQNLIRNYINTIFRIQKLRLTSGFTNFKIDNVQQTLIEVFKDHLRLKF